MAKFNMNSGTFPQRSGIIILKLRNSRNGDVFNAENSRDTNINLVKSKSGKIYVRGKTCPTKDLPGNQNKRV